jgi:hypothetical protein
VDEPGARYPGVERYDDLHIDIIDAKWKPRMMWVAGGIEALELASAMQVSIKQGFVVVLGISLRVEETSKIPSTITDLVEQMDERTPPSLYLFRLGEEPWHERCEYSFLDKNFGTKELGMRGVYLEFQRNEEMRRSYYLIDVAKLHVQL